jgi:hypothetical protein
MASEYLSECFKTIQKYNQDKTPKGFISYQKRQELA